MKIEFLLTLIGVVLKIFQRPFCFGTDWIK
jgi:hypothetical protein